ncbi:MAG: hypothetical protein U0T33_09250 [Bacteroidales bacterium]
MTHKKPFFGLLLLSLLLISARLAGQSVPLGINYQAVARDETGKELTQRKIDVQFTILSGSPVGTEVYQEIHYDVVTSKYGVFSLRIGTGTKSNTDGPEFSSIQWETANHFLKVEIDFGRGFVSMGTMQFMAVPYALFAYKSLEPGPQGPKGDTGAQGPQGPQGLKGDQGDPASDNQTLSFDGTNLTIDNGNTINLSTLNVPHSLTILGDTLSIYGGNKVGLPNQIQDLSLDAYDNLKITKNTAATSISLTKYLDNTDSQGLSFNPATNILSITGGASTDLGNLRQNLTYTGDILSITNVTSPVSVNLTKYLDNTDSQGLSFDSGTGFLSISGGTGATLTSLKLPVTFNSATGFLNINGGTSADLSGLKLPVTFSSTTGLLSINGGTAADLSGLKLPVTFNSSTGAVSINGGTSATLTTLKLPVTFTASTGQVSINGGTAADLSGLKLPLTYTASTGMLSINGGTAADLSSLKESISYNPSTYTVTLSNGNSTTIGSIIAFRARKTSSDTGLSFLTDYDFIPAIVDYNDPVTGYDSGSGVFTAPIAGIYTFNISYTATGSGDSRSLKLNLNGGLYEILNSGISSNTSITRSITMKLAGGDKVKVIINTGTSNESGTGSFSGFRVY